MSHNFCRVGATSAGIETSVAVPFVPLQFFQGWFGEGATGVPIGWLMVPFAAFVIVGASNTVNLTDGLDGLATVPVSGGMTERQVQLIQDFKPDIIMVTPSYMQVIIEEMQRQGLDPRVSSLKVGIFGAEPWTEAMRTEIETRLGIDAVDIYGLSEIIGPGVGIECAHQDRDARTPQEQLRLVLYRDRGGRGRRQRRSGRAGGSA